MTEAEEAIFAAFVNKYGDNGVVTLTDSEMVGAAGTISVFRDFDRCCTYIAYDPPPDHYDFEVEAIGEDVWIAVIETPIVL